jgi:TRAP-type uncharacterized transport system fused permease subunit
MPAFLVPFVFVLDPAGIGLLLVVPKGGSWVDIVAITVTTGVGIGALAAATQSWLLRRTSAVERLLLLAAGVLLVVPGLLERLFGLPAKIAGVGVGYGDIIGLATVSVALAAQMVRKT